MASIRKTKKELKRKFKQALTKCNFSKGLKSFSVVGTYKGYRWRLHIPTNPRKKITSTPLGKKYVRRAKDMFCPLYGFHGTTSVPQTPRNFKLVTQSDFLKEVDPMKHDVMPPRDAIPFAKLGVKSLAEYKDEIKRKKQ